VGFYIPSNRQYVASFQLRRRQERHEQENILDAAITRGKALNRLQGLQNGQEGDTSQSPKGISVKAKGSKEKKPKTHKPATKIDNLDTFIVRVGDQVIERAKSGIKLDPDVYAAKIKQRMTIRHKFAEELRGIVGSAHKPVIDALETKLNSASKNADEADSHIEDSLNELPSEVQGEAFDIWMKHMGGLRGTYGNVSNPLQ
jgi:hypothetical protein